MNTQILVENSGLTVRSGRLIAQFPLGTAVRLAHFGCRLPGCLRKRDKDAPPAVPRDSPLDISWTAKFGRRWADTDDATGKLARGLTEAAMLTGASGLVLHDTMRSGSDYWRPGKLLTDVADLARAIRPGLSVSYAREDELCPPPDLLQTFRTSPMSFGQYAREYAEYLRRGTPPPVEAAVAAAAFAQAQGYLAAFYCTDPYIPGYGDPGAMIAGMPYEERHWLDVDEPVLREPGCHRVVLAEEVGRFLGQRGVPAEVIEVDQALGRCLRRLFVSSAKR